MFAPVSQVAELDSLTDAELEAVSMKPALLIGENLRDAFGRMISQGCSLQWMAQVDPEIKAALTAKVMTIQSIAGAQLVLVVPKGFYDGCTRLDTEMDEMLEQPIPAKTLKELTEEMAARIPVNAERALVGYAQRLNDYMRELDKPVLFQPDGALTIDSLAVLDQQNYLNLERPDHPLDKHLSMRPEDILTANLRDWNWGRSKPTALGGYLLPPGGQRRILDIDDPILTLAEATDMGLLGGLPKVQLGDHDGDMAIAEGAANAAAGIMMGHMRKLHDFVRLDMHLEEYQELAKRARGRYFFQTTHHSSSIDDGTGEKDRRSWVEIRVHGMEACRWVQGELDHIRHCALLGSLRAELKAEELTDDDVDHLWDDRAGMLKWYADGNCVVLSMQVKYDSVDERKTVEAWSREEKINKLREMGASLYCSVGGNSGKGEEVL